MLSLGFFLDAEDSVYEYVEVKIVTTKKPMQGIGFLFAAVTFTR